MKGDLSKSVKLHKMKKAKEWQAEARASLKV